MEANDERIMGIHGKTTICMAINIVERSKRPTGLVDLQKQLISDLFNDDISSINIYSPEQGIGMIRRPVATKKILLLLVLDDVDKETQFESLAVNTNRFYAGRKVFIRTGDYSLLIKHDLGSHELYGVKGLDEREPLQLCRLLGDRSHHKSTSSFLNKLYKPLVGCPWHLEVRGSNFFDLTKVEEWEEKLGRLRRASHVVAQKQLKVSYDGLTEEEKCTFLDIACFFVGKRKEDAMQMWQNPNSSVKALVRKSLVKINSENEEFEMHNVIRELVEVLLGKKALHIVGCTADCGIASMLKLDMPVKKLVTSFQCQRSGNINMKAKW